MPDDARGAQRLRVGGGHAQLGQHGGGVATQVRRAGPLPGRAGNAASARGCDLAANLAPLGELAVAGMANGGIDLLFYAAALLVAWWAAR